MGRNDNQILQLFHEQARHNAVYAEYLSKIDVEPATINHVSEIPFLPISFFRSHDIKTGNWHTEHIFKSSGTTDTQRSCHHVKSVDKYVQHAQRLFEATYGSLDDMTILALLPGYAPTSSLVAMANRLIAHSGCPLSGFYADESRYADLHAALIESQSANHTTVLIGVTFSLLDFAERYTIDSPNLVVMETGGMKGRRKELTRAEIHATLKTAFAVPTVHSEYGMTELLSQAYSSGGGVFHMNDWFRVLPGDMYDPLSAGAHGATARLNIIDLANEDSCAFIATADIGRVYDDGRFEVLGRLDHAQLRGCSLLYA